MIDRLIRVTGWKIAKREIETASAEMSGQKSREADHQPFFKIERLKQNFLRDFERFTEWLQYLDLGLGAVHVAISIG